MHLLATWSCRRRLTTVTNKEEKNYLKINRILVKEGASRLSFMVDTSPMSRVINRTMTVLFDGLVPWNQLNSFSESIFDGRARTNWCVFVSDLKSRCLVNILAEKHGQCIVKISYKYTCKIIQYDSNNLIYIKNKFNWISC